jgi:prevent-host-death family protein
MRDPEKTNWPIHRAKRSLNRVIDLAVAQGAQTVTRYGKPVAVVLSVDDSIGSSGQKRASSNFSRRFEILELSCVGEEIDL